MLSSQDARDGLPAHQLRPEEFILLCLSKIKNLSQSRRGIRLWPIWRPAYPPRLLHVLISSENSYLVFGPACRRVWQDDFICMVVPIFLGRMLPANLHHVSH
jgi:hypothetical protein